MVREDHFQDDLLLDWHLDRLDAQERADFERQLAQDTGLRVRSDRLGRILRPLDHWSITPPPNHLADHVLTFVRGAAYTASATVRVARAAGTASPRGWMPFRSIWDMVAAAACIVLLLSAFVPGVSALRERSRRALCASNMESIFRGVSAYQASFGGVLPFAGNQPGSAWLPNGGETPFASNSRHVFLLVKHGYVPATDSFLCPSDESGRAMASHELTACNDFNTACNNSYSTLNLAGMTPNLRPSRPIAYLSDPNPLFVNARFNSALDPARANSSAHKGKGQTVLVLDGSARWMTTPTYGPQRDNLWVLENVRSYYGTEAPTGDDDVQLVPGYPATDPLVREVLAH